jgi:hypothetical protein
MSPVVGDRRAQITRTMPIPDDTVSKKFHHQPTIALASPPRDHVCSQLQLSAHLLRPCHDRDDDDYLTGVDLLPCGLHTSDRAEVCRRAPVLP